LPVLELTISSSFVDSVILVLLIIRTTPLRVFLCFYTTITCKYECMMNAARRFDEFCKAITRA
jgi:hypothetical protein